jgi:phenylalanyl-tRNA synthetase alpha chain
VTERAGCLHPLLKVRAEMRKFFLEMGFTEMPTNKFVETSFWNFDALFQPQQHAVRDSHDTFFLAAPARTVDLPAGYVARVKEMHEKRGFGSVGWRYDWKEEEARKNILRTHTTATSSRMLHLLGQHCQAHGGDGATVAFEPRKYFSIDRVFRNETLDATHLAEFHQVESLVADRNLTLGDLLGTIKSFFHKIDLTDVRFKPAYNPYTEPSMEIFGFSAALHRWVEIGNSGMFRPEMLRPMGLPEDVKVIAWGLSLERPTIIKYGYTRIQDLFGHKVRLGAIYGSPMCRYGEGEDHHPGLGPSVASVTDGVANTERGEAKEKATG